VWSAEKRAEGLEYMHPKPSSHSGRIVGNPQVMAKVLGNEVIAEVDFDVRTLRVSGLARQVRSAQTVDANTSNRLVL
jgi:hypothetical protein